VRSGVSVAIVPKWPNPTPRHRRAECDAVDMNCTLPVGLAPVTVAGKSSPLSVNRRFQAGSYAHSRHGDADRNGADGMPVAMTTKLLGPSSIFAGTVSPWRTEAPGAIDRLLTLKRAAVKNVTGRSVGNLQIG